MAVAVAASVATLSFFVPFFEMRHDPSMVPVSAYRIVVGFDDIGQFDPALRNLPEKARGTLLAMVNYSIQHETLGDLAHISPRSPIPYYYLSAALLLVVAAVAFARRDLGILGALFTIGGGLGATWSWTRELLIERRMVSNADLSSHLAWGATLLAVAGAIALIAGIGALLWADPGGFRARRKIAALLRNGEGPIEIDMPTAEQNAVVPTATLRRPSARAGVKGRS